MNPRTQLVMHRYRELKQEMSGLEASRVVLQEAQAGTLGVKHETVKQPIVKQALNGACECGNAITGRGKKCPACYQRAYRERSK